MLKKISVALLTLVSTGTLLPHQDVAADPQYQSWKAKKHWRHNRYNNQCNYNNNQGYNNQGYNQGSGYGRNTHAHVDAQQNQVNNMIMRGVQRGRITQQEADRLMARQRKIDSLQARYANNGIDRGERNRLNNEISKLRDQLSHDLHDFDIR